MASKRTSRSISAVPTKRRKTSSSTPTAADIEKEEEEEAKEERKESEQGEEERADGHVHSSSALTSPLSSSDLTSPLSCSPSSSPAPVVVATAAWSIPRASAAHFPATGSHLVRYSARLTGVEINSSFYRHHLPSTYRKWACSTPPTFRFAVKLHRDFTHTQRLQVNSSELRSVLEGVMELGDKLAVLLIQLPPSLSFDRVTAESFFEKVKAVWKGVTVIEARHVSWGGERASEVLESVGVGRVVADPERYPAPVVTSCPLVYYRLHGSPVMYKSEYSEVALDEWVRRMVVERSAGRRVWCTFDNTALGCGTENAVQLQAKLAQT
jgi:uncharacterized protein YecE (DUF72 family)